MTIFNFTYIFTIAFSTIGLLAIDYKKSLAFFYKPIKTLISIVFGLIIFIAWDLLGIGFGIFYAPGSDFATGWYILPNFPLEELLFLGFLCYCALLIQLLTKKLWART